MSPKRKPGHERGLFERDGAWWIRYRDPRGHIRRERIGSKDLARDVLGKRRTEMREGRFFPDRLKGNRTPFSTFVADYRKRIEKKYRSQRDVKRYVEFWETKLGGMMLSTIARADVERVMAALRVTEKSTQTLYHYASHLRRMLNVAIDDGYIAKNPARLVVRDYKPKGSRTRYLDEDEEARLCEAIGPRWWPVVAFAIYTGLRQSEQFRLQWSNVDFAAGVLTIPRTKAGGGRHVELNETAIAILRSVMRPANKRCPWVFANAAGTGPLNAHNFMARQWKAALERAKLRNVRWHDLRHTFASRLVMGGVDLATVQELMGHASIAQTRRYAHLSATHRRAATRVLDRRPADEKSTETSTGGAA